MSFAQSFSHFTGKTKSPIKARNKKKVRVHKEHKNKYEKYSNAKQLKDRRIKGQQNSTSS